MASDFFEAELIELEGRGLRRSLRRFESAMGVKATVQGEEKVVFGSNNYLGLANHPKIIAAVKDGLDRWGYGAGASRLICGNARPHEELQQRLATMLGKDACLIFPSGYMTNHAVLSTLAGKGDLIAVDKLSHASIIDGARASEATLRVWPHGDLGKLERLLGRGDYEQAFIVTDSLFSMDGDAAALTELVELKRRYGAVLMVDEAHAFGCLGPEGKGLAAQRGVLDEVDVLVATFSKALGGAGGFVAGSQVMADYLVNRARGFIYTTAIPAVNCVAAGAALDIIAAEPQRSGRLRENGEYFRKRCKELGLDTGASQSYIVPIMLGSAEKAVAAAEELWRRGFLTPAIRPPTVAQGSARLRISLSSEHPQEMLDGLLEALDGTV